MKNVNLPKKITIYDKIKQKIRDALGYKEGKKFTLDIKPKIEEYSELKLMKLANIEEKIKKVVESNKEGKEQGITEQEAEEILKWTVQNARNELDKKEDIQKESLLGFCGFGQAITAQTLRNMGLNPNVCNVNPIIGENLGRHAFISINIPIKTQEKVEEKIYLIDTTFKQFFLRAEVTNSRGEFIKDKKFGNKVAPLAGYWLLKMQGGKELAEEILSKGYVELTEENAKLYGDSFRLEEKERKNPTSIPKKNELSTGIDGKQYINNMNNPNLHEEIDFSIEEFEKFDINIKTPLMQKQEMLEKNYEKNIKENEIEKINPKTEIVNNKMNKEERQQEM